MATEIPSSVQTSQTVEDLTKALRRMELETEAKTALLALQLKAEQEKSRTLERMLQEKEDVQELQERVKTAEETEMRLRTELVKMTRRSVLITEDERLQARGKELETENFLLSQKVKSLEKQIKDVKSSAVISIQLALVREKETSLLDFSSKCELLTSENSSLQKSIEELKKLRDEAQKQMFEIQTNFEINEKNAKEAAKRANEEISELKEKTRKLISENREKDEEIIALQAKISEIRSYKGQIFDDVKELEANLSSLQDTIQTLRKQIGEKNKAIETLEYELNCLKQEGRDVAGLMENKRKNGEVISDLREKSRKLDEEMMTLSMNLVNSRQENQTLIAKIASMERDRATLLELNEELRSKLVEAEAELKYTDERVKQVRENTKEEMMSRIIALKQEKVELESKLDELQDTIDMQKKSFFEAPSLMDELKQLEDVSGYRRMSILPGSNPAQEKQIESLKLELTSQAEIESLRQENANLASKLTQSGDISGPLEAKILQLEDELAVSMAEKSRLQERILMTEAARLKGSLQGQVDTLQVEIRRLQTEMLASKEMWAEENNTLRTALMDAEKTAVEATTRYAEAAADRDALIKKYRELTRERDRKSTKY